MVVIAGLLIGGVAVLLLLPEGEESAEERAARLRSELIAAEGALEIVAIEYAESVDGGAVIAEAEYDGAVDALGNSRTRYEEVRAELAARGGPVDAIDAGYERLSRLIERTAPEDRVAAVAEELGRLLQEEV